MPLALDATAQLTPRDDSNREASQRRSALGWCFARESSIATAIVRKDYQTSVRRPCGYDGGAASPSQGGPARCERPPAQTGSVPDITLAKPTQMAENRITSAVVKAKLHILSCDQPWTYGAIATSNAGNTDQATCSTPHSLDTNVAETWADAFRTISGVACTPVGAIVNDDHFSINTQPSYTGPEVHVYSADDIIVDANAETSTAVGVDGVTMEFTQAEVADATPTNLRRAIEAGNHLPAIVRWSRPQSPGSDPLSRHAKTTPATTLAPGWPGPAGDTHVIAFATTSPPVARFEGLTQTTARVNAMKSAFTEMARAQAQTATSIAQLTSSVAALVQNAGRWDPARA